MNTTTRAAVLDLADLCDIFPATGYRPAFVIRVIENFGVADLTADETEQLVAAARAAGFDEVADELEG